MLKLPITYKNYNDETVTEDWHFHLSAAELAEMALSETGGLETYLRRIIAADNRMEIFAAFKMILEKAVGRRSEDGSRFYKTDDIRQDFFASGAYDALFMEILQDATKASEFIAGIMPGDLKDSVKFQEAMAETVELPREKDWNDYSLEQLLGMEQAQFDQIVGTDIRKMTKQQIAIIMQRQSRKD